jgi:hypothetical protein
MKFISIVTAVLITCSLYGQGHIEYRDFTFYQDGVEMSLDEVTELTKEYGVAKADFRQGRRDFAASHDRSRARGRNLINGTLAYSSGFSALISFGLGVYWVDGGLSDAPFPPAMYVAAFTSSGVLTVLTIHYTRLLAWREKFERRADKKFNITAKKLNEAILLVNSK